MTATAQPAAAALIREGLDAGIDDADALAEKVLHHLDDEAIILVARRKLRADAKAEMSRRARLSGQRIVQPTAKHRLQAGDRKTLEKRWKIWLSQVEALGDGVRRRVEDLTREDLDLMIGIRSGQRDALATEIARLTRVREALVADGVGRIGELTPQLID